MPSSAPIYLISSDGFDCSPLAQRFSNIHHVHSDTNTNTRAGHRKNSNLTLWLERTDMAAQWCNCSYLVCVEDDVRLTKPLTEAPPHDAGGVKAHPWTAHWPNKTYDKFPNWSYSSYGMCGGSHVRTEAFRDAFANFTSIRKELSSVWPTSVCVSDKLLAGLMMAQGCVSQPWDEVKEVCQPDHKTSPAALIHSRKEHHNAKLVQEDGLVTSENMSDVCIDDNNSHV